jgi:hypothetical protein
MTDDREPDVRIVQGEVVDAAGAPLRPAAPAGGAGPVGPADPWAGGGPVPGSGSGSGVGRVEVRTFDLRGPVLPGGLAVWVGAILLGLGVYLVLSATFPAVAAAGSAVVAAAGAALLVLGLSRRRGSWAVYLGAVILAGGLAGLGQATGVLPGGGWTTLAIGLALLALAGWRAGRGAGGRTLAVVGGILAVVGGFQAVGSLVPGFPTLGEAILPLLLVAIGILVLARTVRRR